MRSPNVWVTFLSLALMSSTVACSLLESDFQGAVTLDFTIDSDGDSYQAIELFNPNDNQDFADNRDNIKDGTIESIVLTFRDALEGNRATIIFGQADVSQAGVADDDRRLVEGLSAWEGLRIASGARYFIDIPADRQEPLSELIFGDDPLDALDIHIDGGADQGPVKLNLEVTLNLSFTAGP